MNIRPLTKHDAYEMCSWQYPPPYDIYNLECPPSDEDIAYLLDPSFHYHAIVDGEEVMLAFCSFGEDGQVPGADYSEEALDIGLGVRPDLTGQGRGGEFAAVVLAFAKETYRPKQLRVTIAEFNERAMSVWRKAGFQEVERFGRESDGMPFVVFTRRL